MWFNVTDIWINWKSIKNSPFSTFIYHHIMHAPITEKSKYIFGNHFCLSTFMSSAWVIHKSVGYFLLTPFDLVWWNQFHPYVCLLEIYLSFPQMDMFYIWCVRENSSSTSPGNLEQPLIMLTDTNRFSKQKTHCKLFINRSLSFDDFGVSTFSRRRSIHDTICVH